MSEENNNSTERHGEPAELLYMGSTPIPGSNDKSGSAKSET